MPKRNPKKPPKKVGAPTLYHADEHPKAARAMVREGKSLWEVAQVFGVNESTITDWQNRHPEFAAQIALGYDDRTRDVEKALLDRAKGYSHPAVKIITVSGGQGMGSTVEQVPYTEHYPPDTEAAKFWLKNRKPAEWRDKQEVEHGGTLTLEQLVEQSLEAAPAPDAPGTALEKKP